jgi:hypothetical protein
MAEFPPIHTDDDDREYYVIATSRDSQSLQRLSNNVLVRLYPDRAWMSHTYGVWVRSGHVNQLMVFKDTWDALCRGDRLTMQAFCDGWVGAVSD